MVFNLPASGGEIFGVAEHLFALGEEIFGVTEHLFTFGEEIFGVTEHFQSSFKLVPLPKRRISPPRVTVNSYLFQNDNPPAPSRSPRFAVEAGRRRAEADGGAGL